MSTNYQSRPGRRVRDRIRIIGLAIGVSLALVMAGCAAIPSSGKVEVGLTDLEQAEQFFQFTATGPVLDSSQEDVVRGFVAAAVSSVDNYAVAREFLTPDYATQWDPYFGVLVDEGGRGYRNDGGHAGVLSLSATAKVDAAGQMLPVAPGPATDLRFEFKRENGQWRLSSAPSGIILDRSQFLSMWAEQQLYFVGPGDVLVPQTRWFIARAALPTEIVSSLLEGPRERMRESMHSGFPAGTALTSKSVPVVDGRARIDMTAELLEASPQALAELRAQLSMSLQSIPGVNGYELLVEGTPLREVSGGVEPRPVTEASLPAVVVDGELGTIAAGEFSPIAMYSNRIEELEPLAISMSSDGGRTAVLNEHGVTVLDTEGTVLADGRAHQLAPSIDLFGYVWTSTNDGELQVQRGTETPVAIAAPWLDGLEMSAVRLSPDGARIAALVESESGAQLLVAGVVRDDSDAPLRTTETADTEMWITGEPVDFDWVGPSRLSVLSKDGLVTKVTSGGPGRFSKAQGSIAGGTAISGGGASANLRLLNDDGELFAPQAAGWQRSDDGIELLAKRG